MPDWLTKKQRSKHMAKIRTRDTDIEQRLSRALDKAQIKYGRNSKELIGQPDFVILKSKIVIFADGDYWHGWHYPLWKHKMSKYWRTKIEANRKRDLRTFRKLRRSGWLVLRLWQHDIEKDIDKCIHRIKKAIQSRSIEY